MDDPTPEIDRIEQEIYVAAPAERLWPLVSRPGWWINDGEIDPLPVLRRTGDVAVLEHPAWGSFALWVGESEEPVRATYRWLGAPHEGEVDDAAQALATTVELTLEPAPGGVVLRVVESGFASLGQEAAAYRQRLDDNATGWANELKAARALVIADRGGIPLVETD